MMARTFARTGRSMKNFEIIFGSSGSVCRRRGAQFGFDLLARDRPHDAADHDPIVLGQAFFYDAQFADELSGLDLALFDDAILVDHEHVTAGLIRAERSV